MAESSCKYSSSPFESLYRADKPGTSSHTETDEIYGYSPWILLFVKSKITETKLFLLPFIF